MLPWSATRISKLDIEKKSNREKNKDFDKPGSKRFLTEKAKTMLSLFEFYILGREKLVR